MKKQKELLARASEVAKYIVKNKATVRQAAKEFGISKSTVHKDVTERLKDSPGRFTQGIDLYKEVRKILDYNYSQKTIRGGEATKKKYKK